jgi:multidrug transporter EmrE-like cation transporter
MISNLLLIYIILIVIFEAVAQSCLKEYSQSSNYNYFYAGILFYGGVGWLLCQTYSQKAGLGVVNLVWSALSIIASTVVGILLFKEKFHTHDILAALLITGGVLILRFTE